MTPQHLIVITCLGAALAACPGPRGTPPPFSASPPPADWEPPEPDPAPAPAASAGPTRHLRGDGSWPCARPRPSACDEPSPPDQVLGTTTASIPHIDPSLVSESEGNMVAMNLFEGLLSPARASGLPLELGVARAVSLAEDGRTYTFTLRPEARWSNGRPVTAEDFVYSWTRKLDPATGSVAVETLFWIDGAEAFNRGETRDPSMLGAEAVDAHTLRVRLRCPHPFWLEELTNGHWLPVPREAVEAHGAKWTEPAHIVTNGPYHLSLWKDRDRMVLTRSPTYWDKDNVRIPEVVIYQSEAEDKPRNLFRTGQIQWGRGAVSPTEIATYLEREAPEFILDPRLCVYFYGFRIDRAPLDDPRVRRAIDHAIDKERLIAHVARGHQLPAAGPVPPVFGETLGYPSLEGSSFDPAEAQRLLAEAGYPQGVGLPTIRLTYNTLDAHRLIAEFVQRSVRENLGISIELENVEWKSLLSKLDTGDFQMARYGWCASETPAAFLELFTSESPRNITGYRNPRFDALIRESRCGASAEASLEAAAEAERILMRDVPLTPIYHYTLPYLKKPVLQGLLPHLSDHHPFKYMYWADTQRPPSAHPLPPL